MQIACDIINARLYIKTSSILQSEKISFKLTCITNCDAIYSLIRNEIHQASKEYLLKKRQHTRVTFDKILLVSLKDIFSLCKIELVFIYSLA